MPGSKRRALKKLLSPNSSEASTPVQDGLTPVDSSTSIASNPSNYMSDEALQQDLEVEAMIARGQTIGTGDQRAQNGLNDLSPSASSGLPPPPAPASATSPPVLGKGSDLNGHRPPPPPPKGGLYAPQQVTAEQLMFGGADTAGSRGGGGKKKSSKQRFAERQARRQEALLHSAPPSDPAWNDQLESERQREIQVIGDACTKLGREIHEIAPDGHCMFNAIADQLHQIGLLPSEDASHPRHTRETAAKYMLAHPDDFMPFLPSITGEDSAGATEHDGLITESEFKKYCSNVAETGEWGGEPEALSRAFSVPIHVIQSGPPTIVSHGGADDAFGGGLTPEQSAALGDRIVRISYHKRMYGLGEHYNSLRKAG